MRRMYCPARPRWTTGAECRGRLGGDDGEAPRGWKGLGEAVARDRTRLVHDLYRRRGRQGSDCPRPRGAVVRDPGPLAGDRLEPRRHPRWHSEPRNDLRIPRPRQHRRANRRCDRGVSAGSGRLPHRGDLHPLRRSEHEERRDPPRRRANRTKLVFTGTTPCDRGPPPYPVICLKGSFSWAGGVENSADWTAGYAKGTTVITLSNTANLRAGESFLILDQVDDTADGGDIYDCGI